MTSSYVKIDLFMKNIKLNGCEGIFPCIEVFALGGIKE